MDPLTDGMLVLPQASLDCPIPVKYRKSISAETFPQISVSKIHAPIDITGSAANSFLIRQIFRKEGFTYVVLLYMVDLHTNFWTHRNIQMDKKLISFVEILSHYRSDQSTVRIPPEKCADRKTLFTF